MAAPKEATKLVAFELDEAQLDLIKAKGGREATPSRYLAECRAAIASGKAMGLPASKNGANDSPRPKGSFILSQLRKAEQQLKEAKEMPEKGTFKKWNREDSVGERGGFVGFQYVPPETPADAAS